MINGLIMNLLQYIFPQAENLVFQFPKSRGRIFLCVSPTFASPIEKPATSALRRICREIIENTEGNAKTEDSLQYCKWISSPSKSAPKRKSRPEVRSAENFQNGRAFFYFLEKFSPPQNGEFFESQKEEHFHFSKNSPGETGTSFCLKKEFEHRENGRKEIRTSDDFPFFPIYTNAIGEIVTVQIHSNKICHQSLPPSVCHESKRNCCHGLTILPYRVVDILYRSLRWRSGLQI